MKTAAISIRVEPEFKRQLEENARREGRTLASFSERLLARHTLMPVWILRDPNPSHSHQHGPRVTLQVADGWPVVGMKADDAEALGKQLVRAAEIARSLPAAQ